MTTIPLNKINRLARIIGQFRQHNPSMPASTMSAFLIVASKQGCSTADVAAVLGMSQATTSRAVNALTKQYMLHGKMHAGPDLVKNALDPFNLRRRLLTLTPKGEELLATMSEFLGE